MGQWIHLKQFKTTTPCNSDSDYLNERNIFCFPHLRMNWNGRTVHPVKINFVVRTDVPNQVVIFAPANLYPFTFQNVNSFGRCKLFLQQNKPINYLKNVQACSKRSLGNWYYFSSSTCNIIPLQKGPYKTILFSQAFI